MTRCWPQPLPGDEQVLRYVSERQTTRDEPSDPQPRDPQETGAAEQPILYLGAGTCGLGAGAAATMAAILNYLHQHNVQARLVEVGCIGLCSEEPLLDIQLPNKARLSCGKVTAKAVPRLLEAALSGEVPRDHALGQWRDTGESWPRVPWLDELPFFAPQARWVLENCGVIDPASLAEYLQRGGYSGLRQALANFTPHELCDAVETSGLRGRGGGGFPTGKKWKVALSQGAPQKYLICNADEGDPGAFMDRAVIEGDPHRLLEGMAIAAYAIGATKAYIYIRAEYPLAIDRLKEAISQAERSGLLGEDVFGSGFSLAVTLKVGAGAFVCGEETALMHSIEGKRGMPSPRPPYPAVSGLFQAPTIINNVETLANLPGILARGHEHFAELGTEGSKGTKVFALSGKVSRTGLVEVVMGTSIREIVFDIGGGIPDGKHYKAVQIGGPSGGCIPEQHLDIAVDYDSLRQVGAMMGSGGLVVMDEDNCMVDVARFFMDFIQRESCGKCIPCREGTRRLRETLDMIARDRKSEAALDTLQRFQGVVYMERLAEVIRDTSLCGLGQSAPNPVLSTLRWFREEYEAHIYDRRCPAGTCRELISFSIDEEKCTGCMRCARACPADAIVGAKRSVHHVLDDKCLRCGSCREVCRFDAITIQ